MTESLSVAEERGTQKLHCNWITTALQCNSICGSPFAYGDESTTVTVFVWAVHHACETSLMKSVSLNVMILNSSKGSVTVTLNFAYVYFVVTVVYALHALFHITLKYYLKFKNILGPVVVVKSQAWNALFTILNFGNTNCSTIFLNYICFSFDIEQFSQYL